MGKGTRRNLCIIFSRSTSNQERKEHSILLGFPNTTTLLFGSEQILPYNFLKKMGASSLKKRRGIKQKFNIKEELLYGGRFVHKSLISVFRRNEAVFQMVITHISYIFICSEFGSLNTKS